MLDLTNYSLHDLRTWAGEPVFERGVDYATSGRVELVEVDVHQLRAHVQGTTEYSVECESDIANTAFCDCPFEGYPCKHIVAALVLYHKEFRQKVGSKSGEPQQNPSDDLDTSTTGTNKKVRKKKTNATSSRSKLEKDPEHNTVKKAKGETTALDAALEKASWRDLVEFIRERAEADKALRQEVLLRFAPDEATRAKAILEYLKSITPPNDTSPLVKSFHKNVAVAIERAAGLGQPARRECEWKIAEQCLRLSAWRRATSDTLITLWRSLMASIGDSYTLHDDAKARANDTERLLRMYAQSDQRCDDTIKELVLRLMMSEAERHSLIPRLLTLATRAVRKSDAIQEWAFELLSEIKDFDQVRKLVVAVPKNAMFYRRCAGLFKEAGRTSDAEQILLDGVQSSDLTVSERRNLSEHLAMTLTRSSQVITPYELFMLQMSLLKQSQVGRAQPLSDAAVPSITTPRADTEDDDSPVFTEGPFSGLSYKKLLDLSERIFLFTAVQCANAAYPSYLSDEQYDSVVDELLQQRWTYSADFFAIAMVLAMPFRQRIQQAIMERFRSLPMTESHGSGRHTELRLTGPGEELAEIYSFTNNWELLYALIEKFPDALLKYHETLERHYPTAFISLWKSTLEQELRTNQSSDLTHAANAAAHIKILYTDVLNDAQQWQQYKATIEAKFSFRNFQHPDWLVL